MVTALGYGTTGLSVGQRVFGLTDWYRDGTLAEYAAVEARNLAPLPGDVDFSIVGPPEARPDDGLAVDFVVESDRTQLSEIVQRVRDGRLRTNIGNVSTLDDAVAAFNPTERIKGKTIIRVRL